VSIFITLLTRFHMHIQRHTAHISDQHTRGLATTRHRSLVGRGDRKAVVGDNGLEHTKKVKKTDTSDPKNYFEHTELPGKLLDYFLRSNKRNINQYQRL